MKAYQRKTTNPPVVHETRDYDSRPGSDENERLRDRVMEGLSVILSSGSDRPLPDERPLSLDAVRPDARSAVLEVIGGIKDFGASYKICQYLDDPDVSMSQISGAIRTDPVLTGRILQTANSAYFGDRKVDSITQALNLLGLSCIKNIIYQKALSNVVRRKGSLTDVIVETLWQHCVVTSVCAFHIAGAFQGLNREALLTLGLLHDVGKFVNAELFPAKEGLGEYSLPYINGFGLQDEDNLFGINHCLVGRLAFERWGLSRAMVCTVETHHYPCFLEMDETGLDGESLRCLVALFIADQVAKVFVDEDRKSVFTVETLPSSYFNLVDRRKLESLFTLKALTAEVRKAMALTAGSFA